MFSRSAFCMRCWYSEGPTQQNNLFDPNRFPTVNTRFETSLSWMWASSRVRSLRSNFSSTDGFLDAARGLTSGPSKSSRLSDPDILRYRNHTEQSNRDFALTNYRNTGKPWVWGSAHLPGSIDKVVWRVERAKGGEDSIPPHHNFDNTPNAIMVTSDIRITYASLGG